MAVGTSIMGLPCITSFSIITWLPAVALRWKASMGESLPPTCAQLVIFPL